MKQVRFILTYTPTNTPFPESIWHDQHDEDLLTTNWLVKHITDLVTSGTFFTYKESSGSIIFIPKEVLAQCVIQFESAEFHDPEVIY